MHAKDKNVHNEKGQRDGYWEMYRSNNTLHYKATYVNGEPYGYLEFRWTDGVIEYDYYAR